MKRVLSKIKESKDLWSFKSRNIQKVDISKDIKIKSWKNILLSNNAIQLLNQNNVQNILLRIHSDDAVYSRILQFPTQQHLSLLIAKQTKQLLNTYPLINRPSPPPTFSKSTVLIYPPFSSNLYLLFPRRLSNAYTSQFNTSLFLPNASFSLSLSTLINGFFL